MFSLFLFVSTCFSIVQCLTICLYVFLWFSIFHSLFIFDPFQREVSYWEASHVLMITFYLPTLQVGVVVPSAFRSRYCPAQKLFACRSEEIHALLEAKWLMNFHSLPPFSSSSPSRVFHCQVDNVALSAQNPRKFLGPVLSLDSQTVPENYQFIRPCTTVFEHDSPN